MIIFDKKIMEFNNYGLDDTESDIVFLTSLNTMRGAVEEFRYSLDRCTFFASGGYKPLSREVGKRDMLSDPRIEGCDSSPFDQHYWLAFDIASGDRKKAITIDPIFGYIGMHDHADMVLGKEKLLYYTSKRIVPPDKPSFEGGIRIKTIGL